MDAKITATVISSSVVFLGLIYNMVKNKKEFKRTQDNIRYKLDYDRVKERQDKIQSKLDDFYLPLKSFLTRSKQAYIIFVEDKPYSFRTLEYLLDKEKEFDGVKIEWKENDDVLLKRIFSIGEEIENLISNKGSIIDDPEFIEEYIPSKGFEDKEYPKGISLIDFTLAHLSYIRDAYYGNLQGDGRFKKYVYPRELNTRVLKKIDELKSLIDKEEDAINSLRYKIK